MTIEMLALIVAVGAAVLLVTVMLVAVRKTRRDRREAAQSARRIRFRAALGDDPGAVLPEATGSPRAQTDLVAVIMQTTPDLSSAVEGPAYPTFTADLRRRSRSRNPVQRGTAMLLLNMFADPSGVAAAEAGLDDPDPDVRLVAARSLAIVGSPEAAQALLAALRAGHMPAERIIERLAGLWALPSCLAALADETSSRQPRTDYRAALARTLGLIGHPDAVPALLVLLTTGQPEERVSAARALGRCGTTATIGPLEVALTDPVGDVRAQAAKSLGLLGSLSAIPDLRRAMSDSFWWVRSNAATSLAQLGPQGRLALREVAAGADSFAAHRAAEQLVLLEHR